MQIFALFNHAQGFAIDEGDQGVIDEVPMCDTLAPARFTEVASAMPFCLTNLPNPFRKVEALAGGCESCVENCASSMNMRVNLVFLKLKVLK